MPTLRAYRDWRGWCLLVDGIPFRSRNAFVFDMDHQTRESVTDYSPWEWGV